MSQFTQEDLVRYLYQETSESKRAAIRAALLTNEELRESFEKLLSAQQNLGSTSYSPSARSVDNILNYAAKKQRHVPSL